MDPQWERRTNALPLVIGADVNGRGNPTSFFTGLIDEVRLSDSARYSGQRFTPERRLKADADTVALYSFDSDLGPYVIDGSGRGYHARRVGAPKAVTAR